MDPSTDRWDIQIIPHTIEARRFPSFQSVGDQTLCGVCLVHSRALRRGAETTSNGLRGHRASKMRVPLPLVLLLWIFFTAPVYGEKAKAGSITGPRHDTESPKRGCKQQQQTGRGNPSFSSRENRRTRLERSLMGRKDGRR